MINQNRGGNTLKTGKIGRVNCLRQQMMLPNETINVSINGQIRLESLRERDSLRINAHLATFMTPLRWLWPDFPTYLREGPDTAQVMPTTSVNDLAKYGVGSHDPTAFTMPTHFQNAYHRVYNEWYKWPENTDSTGDIDQDGEIAVPLQKSWTRCRFDATPDDAADYTLDIDAGGANGQFDVRDLAEKQERFKAAMKRDVLSYNRYMELNKELWGADASREVDQVPMMVDQVSLGVDPREIPATDGASLGQWQSLFDFGVQHEIRGITAPEHCVLTTMLTIRFSSMIESRHPLTSPNLNWHEITGDPYYFKAAPPQEVLINDISTSASSNSLGYLPAGWQWRSDHDVVGERIDNRNSFPMMFTPTTQAEGKDATRIRDVFRSQSLGDYVVDLYFKEQSRMPIPPAIESYMLGDAGRPNDDEFPKQGKML
jgi:hypothetical protein